MDGHTPGRYLLRQRVAVPEDYKSTKWNPARDVRHQLTQDGLPAGKGEGRNSKPFQFLWIDPFFTTVRRCAVCLVLCVLCVLSARVCARLRGCSAGCFNFVGGRGGGCGGCGGRLLRTRRFVSLRPEIQQDSFSWGALFFHDDTPFAVRLELFQRLGDPAQTAGSPVQTNPCHDLLKEILKVLGDPEVCALCA